jgi:hypothetical protein
MQGLRFDQKTLFESTVAAPQAMNTDVSEYGYADFADGDVAPCRCHDFCCRHRESG